MNKLNFEEALQELEVIVKKLESGQINLDESIQLYQKGLELSKLCSDQLSEAEKLIVKTADSNDKGD